MKALAVLLGFAVLTGLAACQSGPATSNITPTAPGVTPAGANVTAPAGDTFGSMAQAGKSVFSANCASCHGSNGEGLIAPALWGSGSALAKYGTAQGLLVFVSAAMPLSSPGSLSHQDYLKVVSYLLIQNNDVSANAAFSESQLGGIALK